ncbi:hypothetical protein LXL04_027310 [Taraxacum kok-saghyz]
MASIGVLRVRPLPQPCFARNGAVVEDSDVAGGRQWSRSIDRSPEENVSEVVKNSNRWLSHSRQVVIVLDFPSGGPKFDPGGCIRVLPQLSGGFLRSGVFVLRELTKVVACWGRH